MPAWQYEKTNTRMVRGKFARSWVEDKRAIRVHSLRDTTPAKGVPTGESVRVVGVVGCRQCRAPVGRPSQVGLRQ